MWRRACAVPASERRGLGSKRIQRFHPVDLVRRNFWQVADEAHELPDLFLPGRIRLAGTKRRHAGKADAVLDDVEHLAVGQTLGCLGPHVGGLGEQPTTDRRALATAVVAVAHRTIAGEVLQPGFEFIRGCPDRVRSRLDLTRDGEPADGPRHARLHRARLRLRLESRAHQIGGPSDHHGGDDENRGDNDLYSCPHDSPRL